MHINASLRKGFSVPEPTVDRMARDLATARRWATTIAEESWHAEDEHADEVAWLRYVISSMYGIADDKPPDEAVRWIRSAATLEMARWDDVG